MTGLGFDGIRINPVGSYLMGLGLLAVVTRGGDPDATAWWQDDRLHLDTRFDSIDDIVAHLAANHRPIPVMSPWNTRSGYIRQTKSGSSAQESLQWLDNSTDARLADYQSAARVAVKAADRGWDLGWIANVKTSGTPKIEVVAKDAFLTLCRNVFPDSALPWLDTAIVLRHTDDGDTKPIVNRLLGTGGNFASQDVSATYLKYVQRIFTGKGKQSAKWLTDALTGSMTQPLLRDTLGQLDPGAAGGKQSSVFEGEDLKGFVNPWSFVLSMEGAVLFAASASRRDQTNGGYASLPFMVAEPSPVGYASAAAGEEARAEFYAPLWSVPVGLAEVRSLFGEGRLRWGGRQVRRGVDARRAIAALGAERGISAFARHLFVDRNGQNPLAVPIGVMETITRPTVHLTQQLDSWLNPVRDNKAPAAVKAAIRRVDEAMFAMAGSDEPGVVRDLLLALGRLHVLVGRSGWGRAKSGRPLILTGYPQWAGAAAIHDGSSPEWMIAAALASGRDTNARNRSLRASLTPTAYDTKTRRWVWTDRSLIPGSGSLHSRLAAAHRRRSTTTAPEWRQAVNGVTAAIAGRATTFDRGWNLPPSAAGHVDALMFGELDDNLITDALNALLLFDDVYPTVPSTTGVESGSGAHAHGSGGRLEPGTTPRRARDVDPVDPVLALLAPFYGIRPLRISGNDIAASAVLLRPGANWTSLLAAGRVGDVLADALLRLRAAGVRRTPTADAYAPDRIDGDRLSAALLIPVHDSARARCFFDATGIRATIIRTDKENT